MMCDQCGQRPAAVHLTQIVDNSVTTLNLCSVCAEEKGVQTDAGISSSPLSDFLASMGSGLAGQLPGPDPATPCANCGATLKDFRETGRLGCPSCYDAFGRQLRDLLRRLHGSSQHVGRHYTPVGDTEPAESIATLREQLQRAINDEHFERAAELRDRIRMIE